MAISGAASSRYFDMAHSVGDACNWVSSISTTAGVRKDDETYSSDEAALFIDSFIIHPTGSISLALFGEVCIFEVRLEWHLAGLDPRKLDIILHNLVDLAIWNS